MAQIFYGTDGTVPSSWTTAGRPASPAAGQFGYNTTIGSLEIYSGGAWGTVGGGGAGAWQAVQTTGFTAVSGNAYACDTTSAAFTVTLPSSPSAGNYIQLVDYAGTWNTNSLTLNPNGLKINGSTSNAALNINRQAVAIVYIDSTQGWVCYSQGANIGQYTATYLAIAGGGGGASDIGGGGGAGGYLTTTATFSSGTAYTITVGAGGAGANTPVQPGNDGSNSVISTIATAVGGGGGGPADQVGRGGGSGGGGGRTGNAGGASTSGQGYAGGNGTSYTGTGSGGGGGGASSVGGSTSGGGSPGGSGASSSITGSSVTRAGGGGGGSGTGGTGGTGGSGGGGNGGGGSATNGTAATVNTGSGGGGGSAASGLGAAGGSGIIVISYSGVQRGTGGTVTTSGGNTIHTFTSSGTYIA